GPETLRHPRQRFGGRLGVPPGFLAGGFLADIGVNLRQRAGEDGGREAKQAGDADEDPARQTVIQRHTGTPGHGCWTWLVQATKPRPPRQQACRRGFWAVMGDWRFATLAE